MHNSSSSKSVRVRAASIQESDDPTLPHRTIVHRRVKFMLRRTYGLPYVTVRLSGATTHCKQCSRVSF